VPIINQCESEYETPPVLLDRATGPDILGLLRALVRGLPVIIAAAIVGVGVGDVALRYVHPSYTSSTSIILDPKQPGSFGAEAEFANIIVDGSKIASVEVVLLSSRVLERVVRYEHLADIPAFGDAAPSILETFLPFLAQKAATPPNTTSAREARAVDQLRRILRITRIGMTYVIKIDATAPDAVSAQSLAKSVADAYLADQIETKLDAAQRDSAWLTNRLADQRNDLIRSEVAVETIRKKLGVTSNENGSDSTIERHSVTQINDELAKAQGEVAEAEARYSQAEHVLRTGGSLEGLTDVTTSKVIGELRTKQAEASQHLADLKARYASDHPQRQQAEQVGRAIDRQVSLEVSRIVSGLKNDYETAVAHRDALEQQLARLVGVLNAAANAEGRVELREAERVAEANKTAYEASLNRLREVEQQQTRQDVEAHIISEAFLPDRPSFPKPAFFLAGGGALGLMMGMGLALLLALGRRRVEDPVIAEKNFSLPVLALTPYVTKNNLRCDDNKLTIPQYLARNPFSQFAESFRLLRLHVQGFRSGGSQVLQVTSAVPGEGKSTVAAGIAISAAAAGIRTVLVDLDLHHPASGKLLGGSGSHGIVDILSGSLTREAVLETHENLPIRIMCAGSINALHPGMIESQQLFDLIQTLRQEYELVILDTPPVLAICDPLYISKLVTTTIMVVAWRSTPQRWVDDALSALRAAHAPVAGILLNKVDFTRVGKPYRNTYGYLRAGRA